MANTLICGFEMGSTNEGLPSGGTATVEVIAAARRTGNYGLHVKAAAGQTGYLYFYQETAVGVYAQFVQSYRFYFQLLHLPGTTVVFAQVYNSANTQSYIGINPSGTLYCQTTTGNTSANSTQALTVDGLWHLISLNVGYNAGAGAQLYVDGVLWASIATGTPNPTYNTEFSVGLQGTDTNGGFEAYYDDILVDNGSVTLGPGGAVLLPPIADSSVGTWTAGAGGATNLYNALKTSPPAGLADASATNTSQIHNSNATGNQDYKAQCMSYRAAGVASNATINAVMAVVNDGTPTTSARAGGVWIDSNPAQSAGGQSFEYGYSGGLGAIGTFPTGWNTHYGPCIQSPSVTLSTAPVVAVRKTDANAQVVDVDFLGIYVDFQNGPSQHVVISGLEMGSLYEANSYSGSGTIEVIPAAKRTGNYGLHAKAAAGQTPYITFTSLDGNGSNIIQLGSARFYMKLLSLPGTTLAMFGEFGNINSWIIGINPTGTIFAGSSAGGVSPNSTNALSVDGLWHCIAANVGYNNGQGIQLYVDGVLWTSKNTFPFLSGLYNLCLGCRTVDTVGGFEAYFDDLLVDNGSVLLGFGQSVLLLPTADSAIGSWTTGNGGTSNLFNAVKTIPPVGVADASATNTSQIHNVNASGNQDYKATCQTYSSVGIDGSCIINGVMGLTNWGAGVAGTKVVSVWIDSNPPQIAGAVTGRYGGGGGIGTFPSNWVTYNGVIAALPSLTLTSGPVAAVRKVTSTVSAVDVDFLGVYVDFLPGTPGVSSAYFLD